jgi:hypothetical protein
LDESEEFFESEDRGEDDSHLKTFINSKLSLFGEYYSNSVLRFSLLDDLADHFGDLELNLYRVGAKHEVTDILDPPGGLICILQSLRIDFKVDIALAMTMKIDSYYMGVDKHNFHPKNRFAFSNQDGVNNVLLPEGHESIQNMYRLVVYNDMIHNATLKDHSSHAIDVTKVERNTAVTTSLLHMIIPSMLKNLESLENGLFTKSLANNRTWLERSGLRCEMYFRLEEISVKMLKTEMESFILDQMIVTMIHCREMEQVSKNTLGSIQTCCAKYSRKMQKQTSKQC